MHILAFKLSPLGDTVMFLPVIQELRRRFPDWRITVFTTPANAELWNGTLPAEQVVPVGRAELQRSWRRPWQLLRWWRFVRRLNADAVLLSFDQSSVARFLAGTSRARIRVAGTGAVVKFKLGVTHEIARRPRETIAEWEWSMAAAMVDALGNAWPSGPIPPPHLPRSGSALSRERPLVVIHSGASREYQRWFPDRFVELAARLATRFEVIWIQRPEITVALPPGVRAWESLRLAELVGLLDQADLFVGCHSGPFHLAAAVGCPCVIIAGPSHVACDPAWNLDRLRILRAANVPCLPCDRMPVASNRCTNLEQPMACMSAWNVAAVEQACTAWLQRFLAVRHPSPRPA